MYNLIAVVVRRGQHTVALTTFATVDEAHAFLDQIVDAQDIGLVPADLHAELAMVIQPATDALALLAKLTVDAA